MSYTTVITTYNRETKVCKAIHSALRECINGEIIVVDDASNDNTISVLECEFTSEIASKKIQIIKNEVNVGVSGAKNIGYQVAKFNWVVFLDSDDWYIDGVGEKMARELRFNQHRPIIFFRCINHEGGGAF